MKYYAVRILCATDESRAYYKLNDSEFDPPCPLDMLVARPCKLNIEDIAMYWEHKDSRATRVQLLSNGEEIILAMTYQHFDNMVMNGNYHTVGENKIAK